MHVVLLEPEIPPNTGNVARLCAATRSILHLIEPLGFKLDDSQLNAPGWIIGNILNGIAGQTGRVFASKSLLRRASGSSNRAGPRFTRTCGLLLAITLFLAAKPPGCLGSCSKRIGI